MKSGEIVAVAIAITLAIVAAYIMFPDTVGEIVDATIDFVVELTTSEEYRLSQLEPDTQAQVRQLLQTLAAHDIQVHVGQTLRTTAQEKTAIDSGHSAVKTHSWHESGRAVDLYPINPDTGQPDLDGIRDDLFMQMQQWAVSAGFNQIAYDGSWNRKYLTNSSGKKIWDGGHIEWHGAYANATDAYNDFVG